MMQHAIDLARRRLQHHPLALEPHTAGLCRADQRRGAASTCVIKVEPSNV
jgi:hypothetical protein